ncbi:hypothetical protein V493_00739, partial [Pseudogymnoascus sp. VKM F-4281 (FW-2241)]
LAAVGGLQGQHPVLAKGDWGSAARLHCICDTSTPDVSPSADAEGLDLSRQVSASICKEKFSAKDRANFDLEDNGVEDIEDELDLIAMAKQSNHTYRTFN